MNETNQQKPLANSEEHEKLVLGLKQDIQKALDEAKTWQGSYLKIEQTLAETERKNRSLEEEKETLKREARRNRLIELDQKETKNKNQALELFTQKFQAKMKEARK